MFPNLPDDLERTILRKYFIIFVVPNLNCNSIKRKCYFRETVLPVLVNDAIMDKAGRIINSTINIDDNVINHPDNIDQLDQMFYSLVNIHKSGELDIFNY